MTEHGVRELLRKQVEAAGGQRAWARLHGVSAPYVNDILHSRRGLSDAICAEIGVARTVVHSVKYEKKGRTP